MKNKLLVKMWRKGTLVCCWWHCKLVQPLWKTVWNFLKKLKMDLPFDSAIPTPGNISEQTQNTNLKEPMYPCVYGSVIYNHQDMEAAQVSINI